MTKRMNIPFSPPDMTEREVEAVGEVLRSGCRIHTYEKRCMP